MPTYLLEIGTEELPADRVTEAQERLKALTSESLKKNSVGFGSIECMGTPRRLAMIISDLSPVQDTIKTRVKGPRVEGNFEADGSPKTAVVKFAEGKKIPVNKLEREVQNGVEYVVADLVIEGKPSAAVLQEIIPGIITQLSGERPMRWGDFEMKFSRPIRWIVSVLDDAELKISLAHISSGRESFGNRVLAPEKVSIANAAAYVDTLRKARVLVNRAERRRLIEQQVQDKATQLGGKARRLGGALLDEVSNILEWPHAVVGEFGQEYLSLPDTLIETVMVHHQRYFPVETGDGSKLLPYFITIANNDRKEAEGPIKQGNERVIKARLADGKFFYFDDQKTKLLDRNSQLENLTFQEGLGSYAKKTERLSKASQYISKSLNLDAKQTQQLERTLRLCKLDLVCNLVRELPELQGYVGAWYAKNDGEEEAVCSAIKDHYAPRFQGDAIPADLLGRLASVVDKVDTLLGLFALGRRPSGSSDPYALRRQAQGIVDILMDGLANYRIDVIELMNLLIADMESLLAKKKDFKKEKAVSDLSDFLMQRVKIKLHDEGIRRETIEAVCFDNRVLRDLPDAVNRCKVLEGLINSDASFTLIRAGVRVCNILSEDATLAVDPSLFENDFEKNLWDMFNSEVKANWSEAKFQQKLEVADYEQVLRLLSSIASPIDRFFEKVMVNDPDKKKKDNRHAILKNINRYFAHVGNFKSFVPLLPSPVTASKA